MEEKNYNIKDNKISVLLITVSIMFMSYHLITGTLSNKQRKALIKKNEIQQIMFENDFSKREAEESYYQEHHEEYNEGDE